MANFHIRGSNTKQLEGAISWQIKALQALMTSGSRFLELKRSNFRIDNRNVRFMKAGQVDSHVCHFKIQSDDQNYLLSTVGKNRNDRRRKKMKRGAFGTESGEWG